MGGPFSIRDDMQNSASRKDTAKDICESSGTFGVRFSNGVTHAGVSDCLDHLLAPCLSDPYLSCIWRTLTSDTNETCISFS